MEGDEGLIYQRRELKKLRVKRAFCETRFAFKCPRRITDTAECVARDDVLNFKAARHSAPLKALLIRTYNEEVFN